MIVVINNINDVRLEVVKEDPIRPTIPKDFRIAKNRFVAVFETANIDAVLCVNLLDHVPVDVEDLGDCSIGSIAVFYSIWSYRPGSAAKLLTGTVAEIQQRYTAVKRFVTLSPKTEMARRFHLKNGAVVLQENSNSVNYEYKF